MATHETRQTSGVALYLRIANVLRSKLCGETWPVGYQLPTVGQLQTEYRAASVTVRHALRLLSEEGLIQSTRGRGTFVIAKPQQGAAKRTHAVEDEEGSLGKRRRETIVREKVDRIPTAFAGLPEDLAGKFHRIKRAHSSGNNVLFVVELFIAAELFSALGPIDKSITPIARFLQTHRPPDSVSINTAIGGERADAQLAALLNCDFSSSVVYISRMFRTTAGELLVASKTTYRAETFILQSTIRLEQFVSTRISPARV